MLDPLPDSATALDTALHTLSCRSERSLPPAGYDVPLRPSFMFVFSGNGSGFRASQDTTYVDRRDAVVRCLAVLWRAEGIPEDRIREVVLVFSGDHRVFRVQPRVVMSCPTPTERGVLELLELGSHAPGIEVYHGRDTFDALAPVVCSYGSGCVVALHECYGIDLDVPPSLTLTTLWRPTDVLFVLGGVRDLTTSEERALARSCTAAKVPCIGVRVGRVVEFSSKLAAILLARTLHCDNDAAHSLPTCLAMFVQAAPVDPLRRNNCHRQMTPGKAIVVQGKRTPKVTYVVLLDVALKPLSAAQSERHRLYHLQRLLIATLWSSKAGGRMLSAHARSNSTVSRSIVLVGQDRSSIEVNSRFVQHLSATGRAAPTERNVLSTLAHEPSTHTPGVHYHDGVPTLGRPDTVALNLTANEGTVPSLHQVLRTTDGAAHYVVIMDLVVASSDTTTQRSKSFAHSAGLAPPQACTVSPLGPPLSAFASLSQAVAEFHTPMPDFHVGGDPRTDH